MTNHSPMQSCLSLQSHSISANVSKVVQSQLIFSRQFNKMTEENLLLAVHKHDVLFIILKKQNLWFEPFALYFFLMNKGIHIV